MRIVEGRREAFPVDQPADRAKQSTLPRHTEVDDYLARAICRQLGVPPVN